MFNRDELLKQLSDCRRDNLGRPSTVAIHCHTFVDLVRERPSYLDLSPNPPTLFGIPIEYDNQIAEGSFRLTGLRAKRGLYGLPHLV